MDYYIRGHKKRKFSIEHSGRTVYSLKCPNWTLRKAVAQSEHGTYVFKKNNFWSTDYTIYKDEYIIGRISSSWRGHIYFQLIADPSQLTDYVPSNIEEAIIQPNLETFEWVDFTLKRKGLFNKRYEIFSRQAIRPMISLYREFDWFKMHYRVVIHKDEQFHFTMEDLLGFFGFGVMLIRARGAAVAAG